MVKHLLTLTAQKSFTSCRQGPTSLCKATVLMQACVLPPAHSTGSPNLFFVFDPQPELGPWHRDEDPRMLRAQTGCVDALDNQHTFVKRLLQAEGA